MFEWKTNSNFVAFLENLNFIRFSLTQVVIAVIIRDYDSTKEEPNVLSKGAAEPMGQLAMAFLNQK